MVRSIEATAPRRR